MSKQRILPVTIETRRPAARCHPVGKPTGVVCLSLLLPLCGACIPEGYVQHLVATSGIALVGELLTELLNLILPT